MAKKKKSPVPQDKNKAAGVTPASRMMHAEIAEKLLLEELAAEEVKEEIEEETEEKTEAEEEKEPQKDPEKEQMYRLLRRLMDDMGASNMGALSEMIDRAETQKLIRSYGLSETAAKLFLAQQEKVRALREAEAAANREAMYAQMRQNPIYADIDEKKAVMEAFMLRTGVTPKEAYNALFGEERLEALRREFEEEKRTAEKKAKHIPALSGGGAPDKAGHQKLSEAEKWAAKRAGMTPEEYARYKYAY